jgi:hypothetical protein
MAIGATWRQQLDHNLFRDATVFAVIGVLPIIEHNQLRAAWPDRSNN